MRPFAATTLPRNAARSNGGEQIRVRFTNEFGHRFAHHQQWARGPERRRRRIKDGTDHAVTLAARPAAHSAGRGHLL